MTRYRHSITVAEEPCSSALSARRGWRGAFYGGEGGPSSPTDTDEPTATTTGTPSPTPLANPETVKEDLRQSGQIEKANGEEGRPLPVAGSWNGGAYYDIPWKTGEGYADPEAWNPECMTELIDGGHHVIPKLRERSGWLTAPTSKDSTGRTG